MSPAFPATLDSIAFDLREVAEHWHRDGAGAVGLADEGGRFWWLAGDDPGAPVRTRALIERRGSWHIEVRSDEPIDQQRLAWQARMLSILGRRERELRSTAEALLDANEQLRVLHSLATSSVGSLSRSELMAELVRVARRLTGTDAVVLAGQHGEWCFDGEQAASVVLERVVAEARAALGSGDRHDRLWRAVDAGAGTDVVARRLDDAGVLMVVLAQPGRHLSIPDLQLIETVGSHVNGMLSLAELHEQTIRTRVLERDIATAASVAALALPRCLPDVAGLDVGARCDPARLAAGDFYTWAACDGGVVVAVGDVSGKGLPAAIVMTVVTRALVAAVARHRDAGPGVMLEAAARDVYDYLSDADVFVTVALARIDVARSRVSIANAGHSPVIIRTALGSRTVPPTAPPLGVIDEIGTDEIESAFGAGDLLVIGSDGLAEQTCGTGELFGYERFMAAVAAAPAGTADDVITHLFDLVDVHGEGRGADDDRTVLAVRRAVPEELS